MSNKINLIGQKNKKETKEKPKHSSKKIRDIIAGIYMGIAAAIVPVNKAQGTDSLKTGNPYYLLGLNTQTNPYAAGYNAAGLVMGQLPDGISTTLGLTTLNFTVNNKNINTGKNFRSNTINYIPEGHVVYRVGDNVYYLSASVPAAAGTVDFKEGSGTTEENAAIFKAMGKEVDQSAEGSSEYLALTTGIAHKINENIAVSAGIRGIQATKSTKAKVGPLGMKYEETANGIGPEINAYIKNELMGLGLYYSPRVKMDFERDISSDPLGIVAKKERRDLDAEFSAGICVNLPNEAKLRLNGAYYFDSETNRPAEENIPTHNAKEFSASVEQKFQDWLFGLGFYYYDPGYKEQPTHETPKLYCRGIGLLLEKKFQSWGITGSVAGYDYSSAKKGEFMNDQKVVHAHIGVTKHWGKPNKKPN